MMPPLRRAFRKRRASIHSKGENGLVSIAGFVTWVASGVAALARSCIAMVRSDPDLRITLPTTLVSRFRSSPVLDAGFGSELRNHQGHETHRFSSVIQIAKFSPKHAANSGEFPDH